MWVVSAVSEARRTETVPVVLWNFGVVDEERSSTRHRHDWSASFELCAIVDCKLSFVRSFCSPSFVSDGYFNSSG